MNNINKFKDAMRAEGIEPQVSIVADSRIHRFYVHGDKAGSKNGWYVCFNKAGVIVGAFGCWKRGIHKKWSSKSADTMSSREKMAYEKMLKSYDKAIKNDRAEFQKKAKEILTAASDREIEYHEYIKRKAIKPIKAKITSQKNLIIPMRDIAGMLQGIQVIMTDGSKKFMPGTTKKGSFICLGKNIKDFSPTVLEKVVFCEGWATGCSLHEATGLPVVVAFDAGNLKSVVESWREKLPRHKFVIAGDNDHATDGNPGKKKAIEAAKAVKAVPVFPRFIDAAEKSDFNDMHIEQGAQAVKQLVEQAYAQDPKDVDYGDWAEPIAFGSITPPDIPFRLLPKPLAIYCKAVTQNTQTPPGMSIMIALSAVAACVQKRFEVTPYGDNYTEPLNLMTAIALEPASRKTAVIKAFTAPLSQWERERAEALREKASKVRHERDMIMKSIEALKSSVSKASSTEEERKEALKEIKRLEGTMPEEIILPQLWTDDITVERLQNLMVENGERIAILSDEGGVFEVIAGLYSGGKSNINIILQAHAGAPVRVQRQGRGVDMEKPALTIGLAVQPEVITDLASGNKSSFRGKGLLARFLYCIPKSTVGERDITKRRPLSEQVEAEYHKMIYRLLAIKPKIDNLGREQPRLLKLSPEALKLWQDFCQRIESKQGQYGEYHSIQDWTGKLSGATLRIAGLCHVVEHGKKLSVVGPDTMNRAIELSNLLILHAKAAFGMMGSDPVIADAKAILQWIVKNNNRSFRRGDLHRALHGRFPRVDRLKTALNVLIERNIIGAPVEQPTGRRPEIVYKVNPEVLGN